MTTFIQSLAYLFEDIGKESFYKALLSMLKNQVNIDSAVIILYSKDASPEIIFDAMDKVDRQAMSSDYFKRGFLLSPYYLHWLNNKSLCLLRLKDIVPDDFFNCIYYKAYYARSGLLDEICYLVPLDNIHSILVSLGRTQRLSLFTKDELYKLNVITPIIGASLLRHSKLSAMPYGQTIRYWLEGGFKLFGKSVLTERECVAVQLMLQGHSSKSSARVMNISPTTERVHRRNIYSKLNISSQAELFKMFFEAMTNENLEIGQDPLTYMINT